MSDSLVEVIHLLLNPSSDSIKQNNTLSLVRLCLGEPIVPISGEIRHLDHAIDLVYLQFPAMKSHNQLRKLWSTSLLKLVMLMNWNEF